MGLVVTAVEQAWKLPEQLADLPVTAASRVVQAGMQVQQRVTELAIKGDQVFSLFRPVEDTPAWARFDEDDESPAPGTEATAGTAGEFGEADDSAVVPGPGAGHGTAVSEFGEVDEAELERHLSQRGFLARLFASVMRRVSKPWHLYPVGLLMGLGFDTATQVALLVLAAGTAAFTLPWYAILVLPVLFAAGMSLFDAVDGILMSKAYGWAFLRPVRKVYYNLTVTVLSVVVALVIGVIMLAGLLADRLGVESGPLAAIGSANLEFVGFMIVGLFVVAWLIALAVWRYGDIEKRWAPAVE